MNKSFSVFMTICLCLLFTGCYSSKSLDRTPSQKKQSVRKKSPVRPQKKKSSDDPLYDAIFHRNPQKFDTESKLSNRERELLREYDIRNDSTVKDMHKKNQKSNTGASDWVFGTENGSYF